jgi:hypothetical protein
VDDELAEFLDPGRDLEMAGERNPFVFGLEAEEQIADLRRVHRIVIGDRRLERIEESPLQHRPGRQQGWIPLPGGIDPGKGAVMELEAEVERQLQVVVSEWVVDERNEPGGFLCGLGGESVCRRSREHLHNQIADRAR